MLQLGKRWQHLVEHRRALDGTYHPPDGTIASALDVSVIEPTFCVTFTESAASAVLSSSATWPSCPSPAIDAEEVRLSASVVAAIVTRDHLLFPLFFLLSFNQGLLSATVLLFSSRHLFGAERTRAKALPPVCS
jgi:hypothetical protein